VCLALACGGAGPASRQSATGAAAAEILRYPVLEKVPAPVTYAAVAGRVADLSRALRELALAVGLVVDEEVTDLDQELRRFGGASPLLANDLASIGISVERSAAVFSRELYPTFVLPVADADKLALFIERRLPSRGVSVRRHRGVEVYSWRRSDARGDELDRRDDSWVGTVGWAVVDDWVIVHISGSRTERDLTWLDDVMATRSGRRLAGQPDLAAAFEAARRRLPEAPRRPSAAHPLLPDESGAGQARPGIVGVARQDRLLAALRAASPSELAPCWTAFADDPGLFVVAANTHWDGADGFVSFELTAPAAAELTAALGDPPPPGFAAFREDSGFYAGARIGLAWLAKLAARTRCELANPFRDALPAALRDPAVSSYQVAGSDFRLKPSLEGSGRAALRLGLRDRSYGEQLLALLPQRGLARKQVIHGVGVNVIEIPLMGKLTWVLDDRSLCVAVGNGVMQRVLAPAENGESEREPEPGAEIAAIGISPARITDLAGSLSRLGALVTGASADRFRQYAMRLAQRLSRYDYGRLRLAIDGKTLVLSGRMRLR